jgi:DNA-binding LacI/PurR family transcriptional regulator
VTDHIRRGRARPPAMTDVARAAGVSHQTVSRVLNRQASVSPATRARVLAAMQDLGYRPNRAARALATGRSQVVGVVAQNSTLYGPASLLAAFEQEAGDVGLAVAVASLRALDRESIIDATERHLDQNVAGIVVIVPVDTAADAIEAISTDVPLVVIDGNPELTGLVTVDQVSGARLATQHLLDAGHQTVWHVSGPPNWFDSRGRIEGWRATLEAAGREVPPTIPGDWTPAAGYAAGQMVARMPEVTAVFTANDHLALGLLKALRDRGRRVPDEISVVGFDDIPEAAYFLPPLTTVRPDFAEVARASLALLIGQIESGERSGQSITVAPELVIRDSVSNRSGT